MVFASSAERVPRELGDARLELVERCGHSPQVEACERMAELLDRFSFVRAERVDSSQR